MDDRIVRFVAALRTAGVRISLAESADAFLAVDELGVKSREGFRLSLQATLVKDAANLPVFDEMFPLFFDSAEAPPLANIADDLTPDEAQKLAEALRAMKDSLRQMIERLMRGDQLTPEELDRLGKMVGLQQANNMRYRDWLAQRMRRALRFPEVRQALKELAGALEELGMDKKRVEEMRQLLMANQKAIEEQLDQYAGQRIAENMSQQPPDEGVDNLLNRPFSALSDADLDRLRKEIQRLAAALRTRIALRQKRARTGQLDAKATIRANLKHGNVPIEVKHREHTLKPRLVVICDVSTSMRSCSELMLSLIYGLQDLITKTYAFAFIDHLEYISQDFAEREGRQAVKHVLERMPSGYYNTDLGNSLENFSRNFLDTIDSRTTLIVVGDGRNNYNNPRLDLFHKFTRRARRTIWLTPEAPALWGSGDSDMLKYAPECDVILQVSNLAELAAAVDKLLSHG